MLGTDMTDSLFAPRGGCAIFARLKLPRLLAFSCFGERCRKQEEPGHPLSSFSPLCVSASTSQTSAGAAGNMKPDHGRALGLLGEMAHSLFLCVCVPYAFHFLILRQG